MFIIEGPYASDLLLETLANKGFCVFLNSFIEKINNKKYNLKYLDEENVIKKYEHVQNFLMYSNSENSIEWILKNLPNSDAAKNIQLFKNKTKFRELLADIYPDFFFKEVAYDELKKLKVSELKFPFVIKPVVGFLSFGVYTVKNEIEWVNTLTSLENELNRIKNVFPNVVVDSSKFLIEEMIDGDEYAVDVYFSQDNKPVVLNIFKHPFLNEKDVSDRIYITSKEIIKENLEVFNSLLNKIGSLVNLRNFPMHIELRKTKNGKIIPIEVNPLRFAGWCTTDMAFGAYGINVYEHFYNQTKPDWEEILEKNDGKICYFAMAEVPNTVNKAEIKDFDYEKFLGNFSEIYELRKIDYRNNPLFAIIFGRCESYEEVEKILALKTADYVLI